MKSVKNEIQITPPANPPRPATIRIKRIGRQAKAPTAKHGSDQPGTDTWITTKVKAKFVEDNKVSATDIHVKTVNGVVQLSGFAGSMEESSKAADARRRHRTREVRHEQHQSQVTLFDRGFDCRVIAVSLNL